MSHFIDEPRPDLDYRHIASFNGRPSAGCIWNPQRSGYRLDALTSAAFGDADFRLEWLIKGLLVKDQPCVVGGPRKSLKTSIVVDLAISLGTGTPFLGHFTTCHRTRTLLISGESGGGVIQETARRICASRGIALRDCDVLWSFRLPQLGTDDLRIVANFVREEEAQVVIFDPLYLCLLSGLDVDAANLFQMGPLLKSVAETCLNVGATPILIHHFRKNVKEPYQPAEMEELAYAGIQEFARQWLLLNRREPYEPGTGVHRLWVSVGGTAGHGGLWAVDVNEGQVDEHFQGRKWDVGLMTAPEARTKDGEVDLQARTADLTRKDKADDAAVLSAIDRLMEKNKCKKAKAAPYTEVRAESRVSGERYIRSVNRLQGEGIIQVIEIKAKIGNGGKRAAKGLKRATMKGKN